jgi:hypothetical protein
VETGGRSVGEVRLDQELQPEERFVCAIERDRQLIYEIVWGSSATHRPIVGAYAARGVHELSGYFLRPGVLRKRLTKLNDVLCKLFRAIAELLWRHSTAQEHEVGQEPNELIQAQ